MQAPREDVAGSDVMMRRHDEMRQQGLRRLLTFERRQFVDDAIRAQLGQQFKLGRARELRPLRR